MLSIPKQKKAKNNSVHGVRSLPHVCFTRRNMVDATGIEPVTPAV